MSAQKKARKLQRKLAKAMAKAGFEYMYGYDIYVETAANHDKRNEEMTHVSQAIVRNLHEHERKIGEIRAIVDPPKCQCVSVDSRAESIPGATR